MTAVRPLLAVVRRGWAEPRSGVARDASADAIAGLMRTSRLADRLARRGHWQDALALLEAAAKRLPGPEQPLEIDASLSPEPRFARTREQFAHRARAALAGTLEEPLATWRRIWRRGAMVLALLAVALMAPTVWHALRDRDLTAGATWRASSAWQNPQSGTLTKRRILDSLPHLFFHTGEQSEPYLDVDLGGVRSIERVVVVNRHDCCYERANGLELLLSIDGHSFSSVAARDLRSVFRRWDVALAQKPARYVRLKLPGDKRILHLADVRVYGR